MRILFVSCLLIVCSSFFVQGPSEPILWKKKALHWEDFKSPVATVGPHVNALAVTSSRLEQRYYRVGDEIHFIIAAWFYPDRSWVKPPVVKDYRSVRVLSHEQHHFDMCELYARKIRKYLSTVQFSDSTYKTEIIDLFRRFQDQYRSEQDKYDNEQTERIHLQDEWTESIDAEMRELKKYSDTSLVVKLH